MENITLKGITAPKLGLGTWKLYGKECTELLLKAFDMGYRHIDTAQFYENEFQVGDAMQQTSVNRGDIFLTTKVSPPNMNFGHAVETVENSLRKLNTDYIDLLLLHAPPAVEDAPLIESLLKLKDQGKIRALGVSNYYGERFEKVAEDYDLFTNQIEWHPYVDVEAVRHTALDHDMSLTAYCPLARGKILEDAVLSELAEKYGKTQAQITLRWLIQHVRTFVTPKTASTKRLEENMNVFDFQISSEDMDKISHISKNYRVINGDWLPKKA